MPNEPAAADPQLVASLALCIRCLAVVGVASPVVGRASRKRSFGASIMNLDLDATLVARVTPSGRVVVDGDGPLRAVFDDGEEFGLLHLGAVALDATLHETLSWWREIGRAFVMATCGAQDPTDPGIVVLPPPDEGLLERLIALAPPMRGAEHLSVEVLDGLWGLMGDALIVRAGNAGVAAYLEACHPSWHTAGRVCLHLAENKQDENWPFAFLATYARRTPGRSSLQHVPLGRALSEYAGERNTSMLRELLTPLHRASETSELIRDLVASHDIYHPLAWSADDAYRFFQQVEQFKAAGLVVRVPDWWRNKSRRASVSVKVGESVTTRVGLDALLDFDVGVSIGGEPLTEVEVQELLAASAGLVFIKGQWVEADAERIAQVLEHWREVRDGAGDGFTFSQAMRILAGADELTDPHTPQWSQVVAGEWMAGQLASLRAPEVGAAIDANAGLRAQLRPYQKTGVQWLWTLYQLGLGGCLADDMGLGKTVQVIGLLSMLQGAEVDLLVVPASLVDNWRSELNRFAPQLRVLVAHPSAMPSAALAGLTPPEVDAHEVVITTYGTLMRTAWMRERSWRCVVLDEAQAIKNPAAKQTRAIKALSARWRLALTGTPVENRLGDLWSIVDFLNPGLLGSSKAFGQLCKVMNQTGYEPLRTLLGPYVLRRLKTDRSILSDLPDKIVMTSPCLLTRAQAALYKKGVDELEVALQTVEGIARKGLVLASLTKFKQICNHPDQWLGEGDYDPAQSGKFERLAAIVEPIAALQEKVLVFTQFRAMTAPLSRFLEQQFGRRGLVLHGGTPVARRAELVQAFQQDEEVPYMVLSLKAGGTGLTLTAANHVVHFDRWWNPAVENQATDRAYRIGQSRNVLVHTFVCKGTIEERIDRLIADKQALSDEVLAGGGEVSLSELSDEALLAMVRLDLDSAVSA